MKLADTVEKHYKLKPEQKRGLASLGITTIEDLIKHLPARYENIRDIKPISEARSGDHAIIYARVENLETGKTWKTKKPFAEGKAVDQTGRLAIKWFNQPYVAKQIPEGAAVKLIGKVTGSKTAYMANPEFEVLAGLPSLPDMSGTAGERAPAFLPIYPETRGITSRWLYHAIRRALSELGEDIPDPIPKEILSRYSLPERRTALAWIHLPRKEQDSAAARKRFAFEEVFYIQLAKQKQRERTKHEQALSVSVNTEAIDSFVDTFPFPPTNAQRRAINDIASDFTREHPMARLLEGDVGSGKTAVAAATVYAVTRTHPPGQDYGTLQTAYMVPTEILARQHFASFIEYFSELPLSIALITGSECRKFPSKVDPTQSTHISRAQLLKWVANGEIAIVIGTHALIQKSVEFQNLAYVIIDEQHRFGTVQRRELARKDNVTPHLLSMSATPIPRTLALTVYGDLDISVLDELPAGRKKVKTKVVSPDERTQTYEALRNELARGRQAYVICPRIDEPDPNNAAAIQARSVTKEQKRLQEEELADYTVGALHGKHSSEDKENTMQAFARGDIDVLVATSVVEVGVNVPNATVIIIEGAERFGLAQLHQLRGRVQRSTHQPYCYVFSDSNSQKTLDRLKALEQTKDGFELAERDLQLRGAGELSGGRQWGISDVGMEAMQNPKMVEAARLEARELVEADPTFSEHTELAEYARHAAETLHFE